MYEDIASRYLTSEGADSVILGCTEVGMLLNKVCSSSFCTCQSALLILVAVVLELNLSKWFGRY